MPMTSCQDCPVRVLPLFRQLAVNELAFVTKLKSDEISLPPRHEIVAAGDTGPAHTLLSGWAFRYKEVGEARQILNFMLPGDLIGLQSPLTGRVRHTVCSITEVRLCVLDGRPFGALFQEQPALSETLIRTLAYEEDRADARLLMLGRQRPTQRLAWLMLDLHDRLAVRGLVGDDRHFPFPLSYPMMADACGLSRTQLARSLVELRARKWIELARGQLRLIDSAAMIASCHYAGLTEASERAIL